MDVNWMKVIHLFYSILFYSILFYSILFKGIPVKKYKNTGNVQVVKYTNYTY